jgi:hypothetical protein
VRTTGGKIRAQNNKDTVTKKTGTEQQRYCHNKTITKKTIATNKMGGAKMRASQMRMPELNIAGKPKRSYQNQMGASQRMMELKSAGKPKRVTRKKRTVKAACPTRVTKPKLVPDAVKSTAAKATKRDVEVPMIGTLRPLTGVLEMVAWKCGMCGADGDAWAEGMADKLSDVEVDTTREFVEAVLGLNERLVAVGHAEVGRATLEMMLLEVGESMIWPGEWYAPCDV